MTRLSLLSLLRIGQVMTFLLPLPLALLDTFTSHSFFLCVCVCAFSLLLHTLPSKHTVFFPLLPIFVVLLPQVSTNFFSFFCIAFFFPASHNTTSIFPRFLVSLIFQNYAFHTFFLSFAFFFFFEEGGYCSDLHLTHTLTHLYILHYNLVPVFSPNSPTHFSFSLVSHPFLLSFSFWFLWPRGNQQTCALCVKMCSPGFVLVWSDLVLQQAYPELRHPDIRIYPDTCERSQRYMQTFVGVTEQHYHHFKQGSTITL